MSKPLSPVQKRYLRGLAHGLKPVVMVGGKGVSDSVVAELDLVLDTHELVKVKLAAGDRETRDAWITDLATRSDAALVQRIGNVAVLFRARDEKSQIVLPR
jgi:RNA-binding protein